MMKRFRFIFLVSYVLALPKIMVGQQVDLQVIDLIKKEAQSSHESMNVLSMIGDVYGPRITGSTNYYHAAIYARDMMKKWELDNPRFDTYENNLRGWEYKSYSVSMTYPVFMSIYALPFKWSGPSNGEVSGVPLLIDPTKLSELMKYQGKLKGKIILSPVIHDLKETSMGPFTDQQLLKASESQLVNDPEGLDNSGITPLVDRLREQVKQEEEEKNFDEIQRFLIEEGVEAVIYGSRHGLGAISAMSLPYAEIGDLISVAHFSIARDQHIRLIRLFENGFNPKLTLNLEVSFNETAKHHVNVLAEIEGTDPAVEDEIVLVGGHFDTEVGGTGAADNGAGCATIMEAVRILKVIGIKPRRTIRIALWDGEEEGLRGSLGYVKKYVGDILSGKKNEAHEKISVYFNMDQNGHDLRGISSRAIPISGQFLMTG